MGATITVVGILAEGVADQLRRDGHEVTVESSVEYGHLGGTDLLVLALDRPEPRAAAVTARLRERSALPVLALVRNLDDDERRRLAAAKVDGALPLDCRGEELTSMVAAILAARESPRSA